MNGLLVVARSCVLTGVLAAALVACRAGSAVERGAPPEGLRPPAVMLDAEWVDLDFDPERGVQGGVEDSTLQLGFDTGQSFPLLLSRRVVERFGWSAEHTVEVGDGSGVNTMRLDVVRVPRMRLGKAVFLGIDALVLDIEGDGSLGLPMFNGCLVTLDLAGERIRIERGELPEPDGATVLEYSLESGTPSVPVWLGTVRCQADIDNGSEAGIVAPLALATELDLESGPFVSGRIATLFNETELWTGSLAGGLHVGPHEVERPPVQFAEIFSFVNLGREVLREFILIFDQRHRRVRFLRTPSAPPGAP